MSFRATITKHHLDAPKVLDRAASVFVGAAVTPIFTVVRGHILAIALTGIVEVNTIAGGAGTNMTLHAPGAVAMCALLDIDGDVVGTTYVIPGNAGGGFVPREQAAQVMPPDLPWDCVVGNFTCTIVNNTTPGQIQWSLAYLPCTEDTIVIVA